MIITEVYITTHKTLDADDESVLSLSSELRGSEETMVKQRNRPSSRWDANDASRNRPRLPERNHSFNAPSSARTLIRSPKVTSRRSTITLPAIPVCQRNIVNGAA